MPKAKNTSKKVAKKAGTRPACPPCNDNCKNILLVFTFVLMVSIVVVSGLAGFHCGYKSGFFEGASNGYIIGKHEIKITLDATAGDAKDWAYSIADDSIISFSSSDTIDENATGTAGGPITKEFKFRAQKEGETTITFNYANIIDGVSEKSVSYKVSVNSDLHASYEKM